MKRQNFDLVKGVLAGQGRLQKELASCIRILGSRKTRYGLEFNEAWVLVEICKQLVDKILKGHAWPFCVGVSARIERREGEKFQTS